MNKSLVIADVKDGEVQRYHMLETIRQYALEKLIEIGKATLICMTATWNTTWGWLRI